MGIRLGLKQHEIDNILRSNEHPAPNEMAYAMLMKWREHDESFTCGKMVEALQGEGLGRLAREFSSQVNNWCGVILKVP